MAAIAALAAALIFCVRASRPANRIAAADTGDHAAAVFQRQITPLLKQYCYECHGNGKTAGTLALDSYQNLASVTDDPTTWEMVQHYVHTHEMPPPRHPQPTGEERELISGWIDGQLTEYFTTHLDPGRVTIHRLNRAEYDNTIRDVVGVDFHPAADFPADDSGYGFDNIGDVLSLPPMLMEKYLAAAEAVMDQAIVTDPIVSRVKRIPASLAEVGFNAFGDRGDGWVKLVSLEEDDVAVTLPIAATGDYLLRVEAYATSDGGVLPYAEANPFQQKGGPEEYAKGIAPGPTRMSVLVNDADVADFVVGTDAAHPGVYEARIGVAAGRQRFRASVRRARGGANELYMKNGRLGKEQPGVVYVKYLEIEGPLHCATRRYPAAQVAGSGENSTTADGGRVFTGAGGAATEIDVPRDGEYILRAQAYAMQAGDEPARMEFRVDDQPLRKFDVLAPGRMQPVGTQKVFSLALLAPVPQVYEVRTQLAAGRHVFSAGFVNPFADAANADVNLRRRALTIQNLQVVDLSGEPAPAEVPAPLRRLIENHTSGGKTADAARGVLGDFVLRAWRRPASSGELDRLMALYNLASGQGDGWDAAIKLPMKAILASPHFVFRGELQPEPDNPNSVHAIDEFALAARLSYFLWSSTPDDELLSLASRGQLRQNLRGQVARMLASPKADALVENFGGQWLQFRGLDSVQPDATIFTDYDAALRLSMRKETYLFFQYIMRQDRSVLDFLDGDYTFVNGKLAALYGIANVTGDDFVKVSLADTPRRGVMTQASVLTLTSNPNRTSPVKRGKWVLENLLGAPPPPPPPDVPVLDNETISGSLRHQMEVHRTNAICASCHARMDPIGFALENFNGIGEWRDTDNAEKIDATGTLLTGEAISGPRQMAEILATSRREDFLHCLSEKMLTYALGRGVEVYDHAAVDRIVAGVEGGDCRFSALIQAVVDSAPFQMRRGEGVPMAVGN